MKRLNEHDQNFDVFVKLLNLGVLLSCWAAVILTVVYFMITGNLLRTLAFAMYTPLRYLFFDIAPSKRQYRPPSLSRDIPLTIFVRYLHKRFPIPQGNILADIAGFFLACGRAMINGYALLFFDTFTFIYIWYDRKQAEENPEEGIKVLHDNEKLKRLEEKVLSVSSEDEAERMESVYEQWKQTEVSSELNAWDFPIKRYLTIPNYYFQNKEVGCSVLDDKYIIDMPEEKQK